MRFSNGIKEYNEKLNRDFFDRYTLVATESWTETYLSEEQDRYKSILKEYKPDIDINKQIHGNIIRNAFKNHMKLKKMDLYIVYRILINIGYQRDLHGRYYELWINNDYLVQYYDR